MGHVTDLIPRTQLIDPVGGTTVYAYNFLVTDAADIVVEQTDALTGAVTVLLLSTDYTVAGLGVSAGGTITLAVGTLISDVITMERDIPIERLNDYPIGGDFSSITVNLEQDEIFMILQQIALSVNRSMRLQKSDTSIDMLLPLSEERKNKFLTFDGNGEISVSDLLGQFVAFTNAANIFTENQTIQKASAGLILDASIGTNPLLSLSENGAQVGRVVYSSVSGSLDIRVFGGAVDSALLLDNSGSLSLTGFGGSLILINSAGKAIIAPAAGADFEIVTAAGGVALYDGKEIAAISGGTSAARPSLPNSYIMYFDTTLGKPIWWSGSIWVDALAGLAALTNAANIFTENQTIQKAAPILDLQDTNASSVIRRRFLDAAGNIRGQLEYVENIGSPGNSFVQLSVISAAGVLGSSVKHFEDGTTTLSNIIDDSSITLPVAGSVLVSPKAGANISLNPTGLGTVLINNQVSGTAVLDEDDMVSDSAVHLATQRSIKAHVAPALPILGSFIGTFNGIAGTPTAAIAWSKQGDFVRLSIPSVGSTSNSTLFSLNGLPAAITPVNNQHTPLVAITDNGVALPPGTALVTAVGSIQFYPTSKGSLWTATGAKALEENTLVYSIA